MDSVLVRTPGPVGLQAAVTEGVPIDAAPAVSRWRRPSAAAGLVVVVGLIVTAALVWASAFVYNRNETRLLGLRVRELALVLASVVPSIQTPLASAVELADTTGGNAARFRASMAPYTGPGRQFASASLWPLGTTTAPLAVVGAAPALAAVPGRAARFFARAERSDQLSVTGVLGSDNPRLGYEFNTPGVRHGFAVYAESPLPADRRLPSSSSAGFSDLHYALYLGRSVRAANLLVSDVRSLPISGPSASDVVAFGDSALTLVVSSRGSLGGTFFATLPWIIAIVGVTLVLGVAALTHRLARRRQEAEQLARVLDRVASANRLLYTEQRSIAETLQHALLPEMLPVLNGLQSSARYVPAGSGIDVGGDWYDVVALADQRVLVVIGDVSGHGLQAAATMAALRHASLAYAAEEYQPATVLSRLAEFVNRDAHGYFATVLCALIEIDAHRLTVSSAGHLAPLLIDGAQGRFLELEVGVPIGVNGHWRYRQATVEVPRQATLVAFTDGLVERRGEVIDVGLARLRDAATSRPLALEELVAKLARDLAVADHDDDTAILGLRWER